MAVQKQLLPAILAFDGVNKEGLSDRWKMAVVAEFFMARSMLEIEVLIIPYEMH